VLAVVDTGLRRQSTRSVHAGTRHFSLVSKSLLNRSYLYVGMKLVGPSLKPLNTCSTTPVHRYTHTHTFNSPFSGTTQVSQYQKGKTNLDLTEARDSEWQCHQLGHMQVCTSLQTDNHASTPPLCFYRPGALPAAQPTASKH